jgi:acetyl-CoA hydrolase
MSVEVGMATGSERPRPSGRTPSAALASRVRCRALLSRVAAAEDLVPLFEDGMNVGWSGFGSNGNPKVVPRALANHVEANGLQGKLRLGLFTGGSVAAEIENRWAEVKLIDRRFPYQLGDTIRRCVNDGTVRMGDKHLGLFAEDLLNGFYTKDRGGRLDLAIVEATAITEEGGIVLSTTAAAAPEIITIAERVIVELNTALPSFEGMHDIPVLRRPPFKQPYLITRVDDRIGTPHVPCPPEKIVAVVESQEADNGPEMSPPDEISEQIAANIVDFFEFEVKHGRLPKNLLALQSGIGNIGNAVVAGVARARFTGVPVWTEVIQDTMLDALESGKMAFASTSGLALSNVGFRHLYDRWEFFRRKIVLRPQQISNSAEVIRRIGVIGMNTPIEFDLYGHANSTHANGTRLINGIGGSGDFLRNSYLSIMHTPSVRATKADPTGISCVVPMVPHVDHTEHDLHVVVTERGLADMRGLSPMERAQLVIDRCAHPDYQPILQDYFDRARRECLPRAAGHIPHLLPKVFRMQQHLAEKGTMKIASWD